MCRRWAAQYCRTDAGDDKTIALPDRVWSVEFNPSRKTVDLAGHDVRRYWMEGCIAGLLLVLSATATDGAPETDHTAAIGI